MTASYNINLCVVCHLTKLPATLKRLTIIFSGLLLIGLLFEWWLLYFSGLNIPGHIPYTPINVGGLLLIVLLLTILIIFIKKLVRQNSSFSIFKLTLAGAIICFIAEFFAVVGVLQKASRRCVVWNCRRKKTSGFNEYKYKMYNTCSGPLSNK